MASYKARQIARIKDAIAAARLDARECGLFEPLRFGQIYIEREGVQIPGQPDAEAREQLAANLLEALRSGAACAGDADTERELRRVRQETEWARYSIDERVIGFRFTLGPQSAHNPACQALLKESASGLGPGVFGKYDIVVLKPECTDCRFDPVFEHDLEW